MKQEDAVLLEQLLQETKQLTGLRQQVLTAEKNLRRLFGNPAEICTREAGLAMTL